jgi:hypothetical protein
MVTARHGLSTQEHHPTPVDGPGARLAAVQLAKRGYLVKGW